jgi:hypothetical protein
VSAPPASAFAGNAASNRIIVHSTYQSQLDSAFETLPNLIIDAGEHATRRFLEFFTANIRNPNTRQARLPHSLCCHTFRATGITAYLDGAEHWSRPN